MTWSYRYILLAVIFGFSSLCAKEIKVAVAANVSYAIKDLEEAFTKQNPEIKVQIILGSSGKLTAQIQHGAPYDIFMSANMMYPNRLYKEKIAITSPLVYAKGSLVLLSTQKRDYHVGLPILDDVSIKKIAIANPQSAPYGKAAKEALVHENLYEKVKHKLVYGESISQTLFFTSKAADIGLVAKSSLLSPQMSHYKEYIHWTEVDESFYNPIDQGIVILKHANENTDVKKFYDFILSKQAKTILKQYGYKVD
ncbi:MAG: molybdate ABC transporter substrate-binding protein [Sulfurovum sp.]|nr:molybdate ABC transporter substrate-binding protein [Sulfurovum sp.]